MRLATNNDLENILAYLKPNRSHCLYMYIDISKYGLDNPHMSVWVEEKDQSICAVVMKYHTSISVFTNVENWDIDSTVEIILETKVKSITARRDIAEALMERLDDYYDVEFGYVFLFTTFQPFVLDMDVEVPTDEELYECAKMIVMDESIGRYYDPTELGNQLIERRNSSFGRSYILRNNGKIVAHIASYAEHDGLATTGGLIVDPNERSTGYGAYLEYYLLTDLINDGFEVYTFVTEKLRYRLMKAMGNECIREYGKLVIKEDA